MTDAELLRAEVATLRSLVVGAPRLAQLARLLEAAHARFGERRWTVCHLVDTGAVEAEDRISVGRFLAEHPFVAAGGLRLVPAGRASNARSWTVRAEART
jgi:uncharacterized protein YgbK (DUF1537 family)